MRLEIWSRHALHGGARGEDALQSAGSLAGHQSSRPSTTPAGDSEHLSSSPSSCSLRDEAWFSSHQSNTRFSASLAKHVHVFQLMHKLLHNTVAKEDSKVRQPGAHVYFVIIIVIVQSPNHAQLFATPWTAAHQASLSLTNSCSLPKFVSIESVIPPAISSSVVPFSSCLQSFPAPGSFPVTRPFTSGG